MYPPRRRRGIDPVADWLDKPATDMSPELEPSQTDQELEGTVFKDPVRDWLLTTSPPRSKSVQRIDKAVDFAFTPIKAIAKKAKQVSDWITTPSGAEGRKTPSLQDRYRPFNQEQNRIEEAQQRGFAGGSIEGVGEMSSPFNIATTATGMSGLSRGAGAVGSLLRAGEAFGGGFQSGMAGSEALDRYEHGETDGESLARDLGMAGFGLLGAGLSMRGPDLPPPALKPELVGRAPRRPLSPEPGRPVHPDLEGEFTTEAPEVWGVPIPPSETTGLPPGDPLKFLEGDPQLALPEHAGAPYTPPPPRGSIIAKPQYGVDVKWQHPGGGAPPPPPTGGPAAPPRVPPRPSAPAPGPVPPAGPGAAFFSPADIQELKALGYDDATIASMAQKGRSGPPKGARQQPDAGMEELPPLDERMAARRARDQAARAPAAPSTNDPLADLLGPGRAPETPLERLQGAADEATATTGEGHFDDPNVDPLTGLVNRRGYGAAGSQPTTLHAAVDIDNLKAVNDTLGHEAGDKLIQVVAEALRKFTNRKGDIAARLGGDEFGMKLQVEGSSDPAKVAQLQQVMEDHVAKAIADAGMGEVAGRKIAASIGFGPDEGSADIAGKARKAARGVSQPRDTPVDQAVPTGVESPAPPHAEQPAAGPGIPVEGNRPPDGPGTALAPVRRRPRAPRAPFDPVSATAESRFPAVLDDARQQGFEGTDLELRAHYDDRVRSVRELIEDLRGITGEQGDRGLLAFIRSVGGIKPFTTTREVGGPRQFHREEFRNLMQGFQKNHGQLGASSIFRNDGYGLDGLLQSMESDGRWPEITDTSQLMEHLDKLSRKPELDEGLAAETDFDHLMEKAAGVQAGKRWWTDEGDTDFAPPDALAPIEEAPADPLSDMLSTGEEQPRLPGDVGEVRAQETPTPEFEAPFSLAGEVDRTPDATAVDIFDAPESAAPETLDSILTRHDVRDPVKATKISESMTRVGWKGRPVLVVRDGNTRVAWTAVHRLDAAKKAGLKPSDVPMVEVDGAKLREAGYDLDDLTSKGKKKRIEALRAIGEEHAAALLEEEQQASNARRNPEEGAADVEDVPENVKEFLVRQLNYSPAEVDALGAREATRLGNQVRMHPEGTAAGIKQYGKAKPAGFRSDTPGPNLGEGSMRVETDELAKLLGIQERRTALQRTRVEPGEGEPATPKLSAEQLARAKGMADESNAAIAQAKEPPQPPKSQSEVALAGSQITQEARTRAKLLENPTPENIDEYMRMMGDMADRQANREFKGGTSKDGGVRTSDRSGEYLASGLGGFEKLFKERPDLFWMGLRTAGGALVGAMLSGEDSPVDEDPLMAALKGAAVAAVGPKLLKAMLKGAPKATRAILDTLPPVAGGKPGQKTGVAPVRQPRDLSKDIGGVENKIIGQPHRTVPDVWRQISPILDELAQVEAGQPSATPRLFEFTRQMYIQEAVAVVDQAARQAKTAGLYRRAKYLEAMVDEMNNAPTWIEREISDLTSGKLTPKDIQKVFSTVERTLYLKLLGGALDSAIINRSQILLAYPHIGAKALLEGVKRARTPEGKAATAFLDSHEPTDAPTTLAVRAKPSLIRKVVRLGLEPMRLSDNKNRKEVYLGAMYHARKQGLNGEQAHEFAMEVTSQTQGIKGELGSNPFHRQLGPLRMFTKYPAIWAQWFADIVSHPDPGVRRRGAAYMLGVPVAAAGAGINALAFMIPRVGLALPAAALAYDTAQHVMQNADHDLWDDVKRPVRYAGKVYDEFKDFTRYGFDKHKEFDKSGSPKGQHDPWSGFLSLLGVETIKKAEDRDLREDVYKFEAKMRRRQSMAGYENRGALRNAIEDGDNAAAADAAANLSHAQLRDFYRRNKKTPYQLRRERIPVEDRPEFDRLFKERFQEAAK